MGKCQIEKCRQAAADDTSESAKVTAAKAVAFTRGGISGPRQWRCGLYPSSSCASQDRPGFFDQHCASKDYDGCDDADGSKRMRVTMYEEPLRPIGGAKDPVDCFHRQ